MTQDLNNQTSIYFKRRPPIEGSFLNMPSNPLSLSKSKDVFLNPVTAVNTNLVSQPNMVAPNPASQLPTQASHQPYLYVNQINNDIAKLGFIFALISCLIWIFSIPGLILSIVGYHRSKRLPGQRLKDYAMAGIIISSIVLFILFILLILFVVAIIL